MLPYLQMANWKALKNIPQVCPTSSSSWIFHVIAHCPQVSVVLHLLSPPSFTVHDFTYPRKAICISGIQLSSCMIFAIPCLLKKCLEVSTLSIYMNLLWYTHTYSSSHLSSLPYSLSPVYISYQLLFYLTVTAFVWFYVWEEIDLDFFLCFGIFCLTWYGWVNPFATSHKILFFLRNK